MKKAGIFAAVIALVLLFMQFYNYRLWAYTQDELYVIDREAAVKRLKNGPEEGDDPNLILSRYKASTPVYTRGKNLFIGEDYEALETSYPVYMNEGHFLYSFSDEMRLVTSEFDTLDTYEGIYVAEGKSFNSDREQADPDEFLFVAAGDGLYFNAQDMIIHSASRQKKIEANSLMDLKEERVSYYSFDRGSYLYGDYSDLLHATVEIGSVTMPYDQLLAKLRAVTEAEEDGKKPQTQETTEEETTVLETLPETLEAETAAVTPETRPAETTAIEGKPTETEATEAEDASEESEESTALSDPTDPDHPPRPGRPGNWPFEGDQAEGNSGQPETEESSENGGSGGSGGSGGGDSSESGPDGGSGEGGAEGEQLPAEVPEVSFSDFSFGVYHGEGMLTLEDPSGLILKGVRVVFYEKGQSRAAYRKLLRVGGEMVIEPLKPDTEYEAEGYFDYMDPNLGKQRVVFFERQEVGRTLPISALTPIQVSQQPETGEYFPYSVEIRDLTAKSAEKETRASETDSRYEALRYVTTVQGTFEKNGTTGGTLQAILGSSQLAALKRGETIQWKTGDILASDSGYHYELVFYDRYGNALPLTASSETEGETRTSKQAPKASLSMENASDVRNTKVEVTITNPDKAGFTGKPYLYVTYADEPQAPISFTLEGEEGALTRYELSEGKETLDFTSLLPSTAYTLWVRGTYDLEDKKEHKEELMGELSITTDSLSSLGTVSFDIGAEKVTSGSADLRISARTSVNDALYPFLAQVNVTVGDKKDHQKTYELKKEELDQETLQPGDTYTIREGQGKEPEITLSIPKGGQAMTPWRSLLTNGTLLISYPEESLSSATDYTVEVRSYAMRGSAGSSDVIREDVTGRYYQASFKTLKQKVYVDYDMSFINSTSATFYDLRLVDPDGAVIGGNVTVRLVRENGSVAEVRVYQLADLNAMEELIFSGLDANMKYTLEFVAQEYNEGYTNMTRELQKPLYLEDGSSIAFEAKNTLWGSLTPDRMSQGFEAQTASMGVGVAAENLFDVNEAVFCRYISDKGEVEHNSFTASAFIPVKPGQAYIWSGLWGSIYCYDEDMNYLRTVSAGELDHPGIFTPLSDCAYIRFSLYHHNMPGAYFSEALYADGDSPANLIKKMNGMYESGYLENAGPKADDRYAYTGYIPVKENTWYFRSGSGSMKDNALNGNHRSRRIYYYDKDKNVLKYDDLAEEIGTVQTPAGCKYVRLNLTADSKDRLFFGEASPLLWGADLLAGTSWTEGRYVTAHNTTTANTYDYQRHSDYVKVKPGTVYRADNVQGLQIFDESLNFVAYYSLSGGNYNIRIPENGYYVRVNNNLGADGNLVPFLRQITPSRKQGAFDVRLRLELSDSQGSLGDQPAYTLVYKKDGEVFKTETKDENLDLSDIHQEYITFAAELGVSYQVDLTIELGGRTIVLDSVSVSAGAPVGIIRSEAALYGARYAPVGEYLVTEDISVRKNNCFDYFYGSIDFQGHKVTLDGVGYLFTYPMAGSLVENLVVESRYTNPDKAIGLNGSISHTNRGTLRNIVLRINVENQRDNASFGGLCYSNYGDIENFAIEMTGDFYAREKGSPGVIENHGTMKNGYLVSPNSYRMLTGPKSDASRNYRAGLASYNYGTLENVYSVVTVEATDVVESQAAAAAKTGSLVTSYSRGTIRNVFGVGQTLVNGQISPNYGPSAGDVDGQVENISYILPAGASADGYKNPYNTQVPAASLHDRAWVEAAINQDGAFDLEVLSSGYYPQLHMPEVMKGRQPLLPMPDAERFQPPRITSSKVLEQKEDRALVQFELENRSRLEIRDMNFAVLNTDKIANTESRYYIEYAASANIKEQGQKEDGTYYVNVEVTDPQYFRSFYYVMSVTAGLYGNQETSHVYDQRDDRGNANQYPEVVMEFYKPIRSVDEWRTEFNNMDRYGNYRIRAEELDFGNIKPHEYATDYRIRDSKGFHGVIDGGWTDEEGNRHTAVLKNIDLSQYNGLIYRLYGTVRNLMVDGLVINEKQEKGNVYRGFIQEIYGGLVENVHIRNGRLDGNSRSGILAGHAELGTVFRECSVSDSSITTYANDNVTTLTGGLVGFVSAGDLERCYVQGVTIDNTVSFDNLGTGGLVGYGSGSRLNLIDCYAEGSVKSTYRNIGGLAGQVTSTTFTVDNCYSRMDLDVFGSVVGGIAGEVTTGLNSMFLTGNLSLGNVFVHSASPAKTHRLIGTEKTDRYAGNYAYKGQVYSGQALDQAPTPDDAWGLLDGASLRQEETYEELLGFGEAYAFSWSDEDDKNFSVSGGYLPLLKNKDGELLPWQKPILIPGSEARLSVEPILPNGSADDDYEALFGSGSSSPFLQPYVMRFDIVYDRDAYEIESVAVEGLDLNETVNDTLTYSESSITGGVHRRYPFVEEILGGDVYCANVVLVNKTDPDQKLHLSAIAKPKDPITREIGSAEEWNEVMEEFGQSYGNFVLTQDIDFTDVKPITNVRINSLEGRGGMKTIKGITHTVNGKSDSLISNCLTGIENVRFEDISWEVAENDVTEHADVGLIGLNQGHIRNVEFTDVAIDSGIGNRTGCVAYNLGEITDVTLRDMNVRSAVAKISSGIKGGIKTGGLVGQTVLPVRRIKAVGTLTEDPNNPGSYTSTYEVRGYQQVGGIVGEGKACESIFVNGIRVLGENVGNVDGKISYVGGIVGLGDIVRAGGNSEENEKLASTIVNSVVETAQPQDDGKRYDAQRVGGAIGQGSAYFVHGKNLSVQGPMAEDVGGLSGTYTEDCDIATVSEEKIQGVISGANLGSVAGDIIQKTRITGLENVGGASGESSCNRTKVSFVEVEATKMNAGGLTGYSGGGINGCVVDSVTVRAPQNVGGIAGYNASALDGCLVSRSDLTGGFNVGGIFGYTKGTFASASGVVDTTISAEKSADDENNPGGESNVGGIVGKADAITYLGANYVKDCTIKAAGDNAGGIVGAASGGNYYRNVSHATVEANGRNAGGLIGKLTGFQPTVEEKYRIARLYENYSYSMVKADDYAGGLVGLYTCDEGAIYHLTAESAYGILSLGHVESGGPHGSLFVNADEAIPELKAEGAYLRVFDGAALTVADPANGQKKTQTAKEIYSGTWDAEKPVSAGGTKADGITPALSGVLRVTSENLMDKRLYINTYDKGGMQWTNNWDYEGLGRMDPYKEIEVHKSYGDVALNIWIEDEDGWSVPENEESAQHGYVFDQVPAGETPKAEIVVKPEEDETDTVYYWYRLYDPKTTTRTQIKDENGVAIQKKELELAGRGYYVGLKKKGNVEKWTSVIKVDTPGYLPYLKSGTAVVRNALEGFTPELKDGEPLMGENGYKVYNGKDMLYYGGIEVPTETSGTIGTLDLKDGAAQVYPSGADTINVELNADFEGLTRLTVEAGGKKLLDEKPDKRVYTLSYDYQSPVTVKAESGAEQSSVTWDATELRRTVMVWGDDYYYTSDGKLYDGSGVCLDRQILHLYGGKALGIDGTVYEVESGKALDRTGEASAFRSAGAYAADGVERGRAVPVAEASYEGRYLKTYGSFTEIATAANAALAEEAVSDEIVPDETVREQQLFVKDGSLFSMENSQSSRGFVLDTYNGQTFMSALNDKGELKDYADSLTTPEHFRRKNIAHMTNAMDSDEPILLVRYATGEARGFNYLTGEELPVENAFSDVSFLDFASGFMEDLIGQTGQENKAFADLKKLEEELKLSPITEEELKLAQKVIEGAVEEEAEEAVQESEEESLNESLTESAAVVAADGSSTADGEGQADVSETADDASERVDGLADGDGEAEGDGAGFTDGKAEGDGNGFTDGEAENDGSESVAHESESDKAEPQDGESEGEESEPDDSKDESGEAESVEPEPFEQSESRTEEPESASAGESQAGESQAGAGQQTVQADYVYSFNTDEETYGLYNSRELLSRRAEELLSEQKKLETLQEAGLFAGDTYVKSDTATKEEKKGLAMFAVAAFAALSLSGILIYRRGARRRKDDKK